MEECVTEDWYGRAVRRGIPQQDDGGRTATECRRYQRRATAQEGAQVSQLITHSLYAIAIFTLELIHCLKWQYQIGLIV